MVVERDRGSRTVVFGPLAPAVRRLLAALTHFRSILPDESFSAIALAFVPEFLRLLDDYVARRYPAEAAAAR